MLTARQSDVLGLIARGLTTPQIAVMLDLSEHTVKEYRKAAYRRLGARNYAHAVDISLRKGLIVP